MPPTFPKTTFSSKPGRRLHPFAAASLWLLRVESRFPLQIGRMLGVLSLRRTKSKGWTKAMSNGKAYEGMPSDHINDFRTHKLFTEANYTVTSFYLRSNHLSSHFCWGGSIASLFLHWGVRKWFGMVSCAWEKALLCFICYFMLRILHSTNISLAVVFFIWLGLCIALLH